MSLYLGTNLISGVATPVEGARNIGQIVQSTIPLTDAGLHLLDGALISGSGSYADFVTYISNLDLSASYFCTEAEWQTSVTNYGVCDKFVYDSVNNTVRLPKRNTEHGVLIKSYSSGTDWYRVYSDGWCEQGGFSAEGTVTLLKEMTNTNYAIFATSHYNTVGGDYTEAISEVTTQSFKLTLDPTATQNSDKAYWQACGYVDISDYQYSPIYEYLVIATSTKTQIEVDIDEIATDLNGKADVDLTNCTKPHIVETYINGTSWYRVYSDGWCEQGGFDNSGSGSKNITLLKAFINTDYSVLANSVSSTTAGGTSIRDNYKTTTSFGVYKSNSICYWRACGYIS